jgi:hypothetical protein
MCGVTSIYPFTGIPMKLVWLIKMHLNKIYSKIQTYKHLCDVFPIQNYLNQEMLYHQDSAPWSWLVPLWQHLVVTVLNCGLFSIALHTEMSFLCLAAWGLTA